ncbi:hypothetical protein AB1K83_08820 [Sporosarcina sp. 179-K 3D1 HS]|uniref:hypothetical protein n=1 Tax=Sporosarcina sp. 179-K 3D1 HS TaxID=3232169 RepID=UPI0039A0C9A1
MTLIAFAAIMTFRSTIKGKVTLIALLAKLLLFLVFHIHPVVFVFAGLVGGLVVHYMKKIWRKKR